MKNKLVSVIVPVYNCENYLKGCIESILNQSHKNLELILVDDGSKDKSTEIAENYKKDERVKLFHIPNSGPAQARNIGINNSRGEFLFFIDSDDLIREDSLELLLYNQKSSGAELVIGDFKKVKNNEVLPRTDNQILESREFNKKELIEYARSYLRKPNKNILFGYMWGRLFDSKIINENKLQLNPKLHTFEDVDFNFKFMKYIQKAYFSKSCIYDHTQRDGYISATMNLNGDSTKLLGYVEAIKTIGEFLKGNLSEREIDKEMGQALTTLSIIQLIRCCGQINSENKQQIYKIAKNIVREPFIRERIKYYIPSKGESKMIPFFMKYKLITPLIKLCKYKHQKRYKK